MHILWIKGFVFRQSFLLTKQKIKSGKKSDFCVNEIRMKRFAGFWGKELHP